MADELHRGLAGLPRPAFLDARDDVWARADRAAWGESGAGDRTALPEVERLLAARRPLALPSQIVHGDLSGNVLFAEGLPPAVIDLSPYWRPAAYARAVVAVDARLWHGAGPGLTARAAEPQLILRALLFRLLCARDPVAQALDAAPLVAEVLAGAGAAEHDAGRAQQDGQVERERAVLEVVEVVRELRGGVVERCGVAARGPAPSR